MHSVPSCRTPCAPRSFRTSKRGWSNSRSNSAVIREAIRFCRGRGPFRQGEELAKTGQKSPTFFPVFPARRIGHREQTKAWRTCLYGGGKTALAVGGRFSSSVIRRRKAKGKSKKAKVLRRRSSPHLYRMPAPLVRAGEQVIIAAAVVAALRSNAGVVPAW